jgi:hypothetical protein
MGQMSPLFNYCHHHPGVDPYNALNQYVAQIQANAGGAPGGGGPGGNPQQQQQGGGMPQAGPRTPGFVGNMGIGASPAMAHMQLPGSPHVGAAGSPIPGHMQAPGMAMQKSHQGTSSSGPSANTSPASNKRRRASGVKIEEDGTTPGAQVNGVGKKNPPTPRMPKKAKTSAS